MKEISTIFFDVGGVCLTNGWDEVARKNSTKKFSLNFEEMEIKHEKLFEKFEKGMLLIDDYLREVVFFRKRDFTKKEFIEFMYEQSLAFDSTFKILEKISSKKRYRLATINNESLELNDYRINKFGLEKYFECFFSSCYLGVRKPEPEIFHKALHILHKNPGECLFIDDREENYNAAKDSGLNSILFKGSENLQARLKEYGIEL